MKQQYYHIYWNHKHFNSFKLGRSDSIISFLIPLLVIFLAEERIGWMGFEFNLDFKENGMHFHINSELNSIKIKIWIWTDWMESMWIHTPVFIVARPSISL